MSELMYALGVVLLVLGVAASIGLHEVGHLVPAKRFGVKVTQYFVGFGTTVWSRRRGETEYGVKAVPLGGYVKLVGMLPPGPSQQPGGSGPDDATRCQQPRGHAGEYGGPRRQRRGSHPGMFARLVADARATEYQAVEPGDENRLFYRLPWWKKVVVMASGAAVNLVLAFVLFGGVFMLYGVLEPTTTVGKVSDCVVAATEGQRACAPADPVAPAKLAGLRTGDRVLAMNGTRVTSWDQFTRLIRANRDGSAVIVFERDGRRRTTTTNTTVSPRRSVDDPARIVRVGFLGVAPQFVRERQGPLFVVATMGDYTWQTVSALAQMPARLFDVTKAALGLEERRPDSPMSVVGASRVAGQMTSAADVPLGDRLVNLVMLLGGINLFVGMFNFVPLLPLDGGHIAGALYEAVRRGLARLLRRPDPGYFDVAKLLPAGYLMAGVILVMSLVLVYADIVAPVRLG